MAMGSQGARGDEPAPAGAPRAQHAVTAVTYPRARAAGSVVCLPVSLNREDKALEGKRPAGEVGAESGPSWGAVKPATSVVPCSCSAFTLTVPRAPYLQTQIGAIQLLQSYLPGRT